MAAPPAPPGIPAHWHTGTNVAEGPSIFDRDRGPWRRNMEEWQQLLKDGINNAEQLFERFGVDKALAERISQDFRIRINADYLSLIEAPGDPIWRLVVPDAAELDDVDCPDDPLNEEGDSPVPNLTH